MRELTIVHVDPAMQRAYEQPAPVTDPALQRRLEAQKRKNDMKKFLACNTSELPSMRPGELTRKYITQKLQKLDEDAFLL
jgi:hypothetical protein